MAGRPVVLVVCTVLVALFVLGILGRRVFERDQAAMYASYAHEQRRSLEEVAAGLANDIADIGQDLDLATELLADAESHRVAERELHAIATIKREYMIMDARTTGGMIRVIAFDAPRWAADLADGALRATLDAADATPGRIRVSGPLSPNGQPGAWYRVFARCPAPGRPTVAIAVDMAILLNRLRTQREPRSRLVVLTPGASVAVPSEPPLDGTVADPGEAPREIVSRIQAGRPDGTAVDAATAASLGLPRAIAVAVAVPVKVGEGQVWTILLVVSTSTLDAQQAVLVRRVLSAGGLILLLLLSAAGYVVYSTRRTATLRERLHQADRLAYLTEQAEKIVEYIPSGVLTLSEDRQITSANPWFRNRIAREITGKVLEHAFESAEPHDLEILRDLVDRALETREPQQVPRMQLSLFGQEAFFSVRVIPLERGMIDVRVLVVFDDLTLLRRIEERLLHSEKLVTAGQLAAGIAHEIGTPLSVARGRIELALSHLGPQHADAANHRTAIEQIDRVTRLIQQLLEYVRPAPGTMQHVDLAAVLHAVVELLSAQAGKRGVKLQVDVPNDLRPIHADPDHVQQVVINLVLNAIDACERDGNVGLYARSRDRAVVLEVRDDGQGIPAENQAQVFDPFFTTKKRGQGTGLGLWVVAQLVRAHAGEIELESAPSAGTTVRVLWPVNA